MGIQIFLNMYFHCNVTHDDLQTNKHFYVIVSMLLWTLMVYLLGQSYTNLNQSLGGT